MATSISRRHILAMGTVAMGAAGIAGAVLPLGPGAAAEAAPRIPLGDPTRIFNVKSFGAKGDGITIDTGAINRAIDAAARNRPPAGGGSRGTVYFPAGTYSSYSIHLKSDVAIYLEKGATLLAAKPVNGKGYDPPEPGVDNSYQDYAHNHWHTSLMWGVGLTGVTIAGPGVIDGKGLVGGPGEEKPGAGNKAIALKLCRDVTIRDITILNGGSLAILPTGVDNLRVENLTIDTYSDGINVDCCRNVRISGCVINTPNADAICLKSSYALNEARATENVTIRDCTVSGYDLGTLYDGTRKIPTTYGRIGRIKFGTESNGGFKKIAISNVTFEYCSGLALQCVDGGVIEDVKISGLTMRQVRTPIFLRLGSRMSAPPGTSVGELRRVSISDVAADNCDPRFPSTISGIPGHPIEDVRISDVRHTIAGGLTPKDANQNPPEEEKTYPEVDMFGTLPTFGFFIRHVAGITLDDAKVTFIKRDTRPAYVLRDVTNATFRRNRADKVSGSPTFVLDDVHDFDVTASSPVSNIHLDHVGHKEL